MFRTTDYTHRLGIRRAHRLLSRENILQSLQSDDAYIGIGRLRRKINLQFVL